MFAKLFSSDEPDSAESEVDEQESLAYAAAMLLFEVAWADHEITPEELLRIDASLQSLFGVTQGTAQRLAERARIEHVEATSMYPFTREVKDALDADERYILMVALWQLALADEDLGTYEESAIRSIAELLYVSHRNFIRAKLEAKRLQGSSSSR